MKLENITIKSLLPLVFSGMEETEKIRSSQVWEEPSLTFERGCRLCIQAESGNGKSSLLNFIFGNRIDYKGEILFNGTNVKTLTVEQWCDIRTHNIALLQQDLGLFPELTVAQNIDLKNNRTQFLTTEQIKDYLTRLGIAEKYDAPVGKLSVGQMQRVALVRSIAQPFDFIFLDEPVSHLDQRNNSIVAEIITEVSNRQGAGVIATSVGNHLLLNDPKFISL